MTPYGRSWSGAAALVSVIGLWGAYRGFALPVLVAMAVTVSVVAVMWALPFVPDHHPLTRPLVRAGVVGALLTWIVMGMAHLAGYVGVVAVVALAAASPVLRTWCGPLFAKLRRLHPSPPPEVVATTEVTDSGPVDTIVSTPGLMPDPVTMSDLDLCRAWRRSFVLLERTTTARSRLLVVRMRASYLDELEQRGGDAFRAWLESGARAAGDPSRCLGLPGSDDGHRSVSE